MEKSEAQVAPAAASANGSVFRWAALALVFSAAIINYLDRQAIALLKPTLEAEFGWSDIDYAHIVSGFQLATVLSILAVGWFVDRVGLRAGYAIGVGGWSFAQMLHAVVTTVTGFFWVRVALGVTEAVNTPAAVKTVATWFKGDDRSLALGIMNVAPNLGAVATPLIVPAIAIAWGWKAAFIATGAIGFVWLAFWFALPKPRGDGEAVDAAPETSGKLVETLKDERTWVVAVGKFLTDFVWVFLLFWAPDLFVRKYGLDQGELAGPVAVVFLLAGAGSYFAGWLSSRLLASGKTYNRARKTPMVIGALLAAPVPIIALAPNVWVGAVLVGMTLAAHQMFSTSIFGLATDIMPARKVGIVIGFGATFGSLSGLLMNEFTGVVLEFFNVYWPMLAMCATAKFAAVLVIHWMQPDIDKTRNAMLAEERIRPAPA